MATPHDELFKAIFSDVGEAGAEFRAALPPAVVDRIDWSTLRRLSAALPDAVDAERRADLLFAVDCGGRDLLLHLLLEHKSQEDRWVALQVQGYAMRIWQRHRRERPRVRHLPPVISVVVHHGARPWRGSTDFLDLFDLDAELRRGIGRWLPRCRFVLDDLTELGEDELLSRVVSNFARLGLACLQRIRRGGDPEAVLRGLRGLFHAVLGEPSPSRQLVLVISYLTKVWDLEAAAMGELVRRELGPELEQTMTSTHDRLVNQGMERGLERGLEKGLEQGLEQGLQTGLVRGRAEGRVETLLEQLTERFGSVPSAVVTRVRGAADDQVRAWARSFATAATLEDVFRATSRD